MNAKLLIPVLLILAFLFFVPAASAHDVTLTYMTLNATPPDARVDMNVPAGNFKMLYPNRTLDQALAVFPGYMRSKLTMRSESGNCTADVDTEKDAETVKVSAIYRCGTMRQLNISYRMFFEISDTHENILDIFIGGTAITGRTILSEQGVYDVNIAVAELTDTWKAHQLNQTANATAGNQSEPVENATSITGLQQEESTIASFFILGIEHIFTGYDHVLFIIGILLITALFWQLTKIITSFTVAHTITLILATLGVVALSPRITEPLIAATIVFIAAENIYFLKRSGKRKSRKKHSRFFGDPAKRWRITFALGLIHGFGFSSVLRDIGLPEKDLIPALLSFNLGVEAGQLAIVAVLFPLLIYSRRFKWQPRAILYLSALIGIIGALWFIQRIFF
ncbi:MAG: HupE/UreJ family protein [Candidatus Aenigmarchaeota archaeon]|nr:HupE/UreJ family protein [Candidatus Aenigmarchaeota archaeon]